jgi:hypothetical protein
VTVDARWRTLGVGPTGVWSVHEMVAMTAMASREEETTVRMETSGERG